MVSRRPSAALKYDPQHNTCVILIMRQNSTLKKMNSYLCVIDTLKLNTFPNYASHNYKSASARARYTHV